MSISIYYTVKLKTSLTIDEGDLIQSLVEKYSIDKEIEIYLKTGKGLN